MTLPISLYIHFPWCVQKCPYCDFNSHAVKNRIPEADYLNRLLQDFDQSLDVFQNRPIHSIFMGGGTPSLFSPASIDQLLNHLQKKIPFRDQVEITLEANPGTVDEKNFAGFYAAGVNRLSIGVQSFNPIHLKKLGRIHDDEGAKRAIQAAKNAGFQNFNLDLMHGLPDQTLDQALMDLKIALSFQPTHLSWYQLTIEPNTVFYKMPPVLPTDDALAVIQDAGEQLLEQHGFEHYEISAFAKKGYQSQHNLNYWQFGDYLGIGAGAHSKVTPLPQPSPTCGRGSPSLRSARTRQPKDYLDSNKSMIATQEVIQLEQLPFEFMMNAMRLHQPIMRETFEQRTGLSWQALIPKLKTAAEKNLIEFNEEKIIVTLLGRRFLNDLLGMFLS